MNPGDALATIAESQIGIRSDTWSDRASLYGYLLATHAHDPNVFGSGPKGKPRELHWVGSGFGTPWALHSPQRYSLLPELQPAPDPPVMLRFHNWCAAFVDWCVREMLLKHPNLTPISFAHRPTTTMAVDFLVWGRKQGCTVFEAASMSPQRGDIAVYAFHTKKSVQNHVGICSRCDAKSSGLFTVEGNTSPFKPQPGQLNQGFEVVEKSRERSQLKGLVRLPAKR